MKTKIAKKLKPHKPRGKHAKIAYLKRSAAGKAVHHRRLVKRHAKVHALAIAIVTFFVVSAGVVLASQADNLVAPPGNDAQVNAYIRAAQAATQAKRAQQTAAQAAQNPNQIGAASWYAIGLPNPDALTCASTTFPRGTHLRVHDLRNGREVICLVNDYGPTPGTKRVIDLSRGSYSALEGLGSGTMPVEIWAVASP
jgi:rare lipoprotein A (peptidoglycan hydrolase)